MAGTRPYTEAPPELVADPALPLGPPPDPEPDGYWIVARGPDGEISRRDFARWQTEFQKGEAVILARAELEFEGGLNAGERPRRRLVDLFRIDLGYEAIPIPPGTPLMRRAEIAKWKDKA